MQRRHEQHCCEQCRSDAKGIQAVWVGQQSQADDGVPASAVESVEQSGKGQGGECHGGCHGGALCISDSVGTQRRRCDQTALGQQSDEEVPGQDPFAGIARPVLQEPGVRGLHADGEGWERICEQIDKEQMNRRERHSETQDRGVEDAEDGRSVSGQEE